MTPNLLFNNYGHSNPSVIASIIMILLVLLAAIFGFFGITGEGDLSADYQKDFLVVNPAVNQSLYVIGALDNIVVEQILSNGTIVFVNPTDYIYENLYVTVNHTILI